MKDQHKQRDSLTASRRNPTSRKALPRLTARIDFDAGRAVGPGKIKLMELIEQSLSSRRNLVRILAFYPTSPLLSHILNGGYGAGRAIPAVKAEWPGSAESGHLDTRV